MDLSVIKKILIVDFSRIGDTLMHDPAIRALKLTFPKAQFYALTDRANFDLLAHHPAIFKARIFPRIRNFASLIAYIRSMRWIRRQGFDLLINFYMGGAAPAIGRFSGIPLRLSFDKKPQLRKAYNILVKSPSSYSNWMVETNQILKPLGIDPALIWPQVHFFVAPEHQTWASTIIPAKPGAHYAAYQLAASEAHKCWSTFKFATLAEKLYRDKQLIPVVIASPDQLERVEEFFKVYPAHLPQIRLPVLSLPKLASILERMDILITGDTGIMHLGFGVDTPTVALFANRPEYVVSATTNKIIVFHEDAQAPKYPSGQLHGNIDFSVEEVNQAVETLLMMQK